MSHDFGANRPKPRRRREASADGSAVVAVVAADGADEGGEGGGAVVAGGRRVATAECGTALAHSSAAAKLNRKSTRNGLSPYVNGLLLAHARMNKNRKEHEAIAHVGPEEEALATYSKEVNSRTPVFGS